VKAAPRWRENPGHIPPALNRKGAKCHVELRNGTKPSDPWTAQSINWSLNPAKPSSGYDVLRYRAEVE